MGNSSPTYEIEGKLYDRITRVLDHFPDPELVKWKLKVGPEEARRIGKVATKVGSRADELIKTDVITGAYSLKKSDGIEVRNCMEGWELFKREHPEVKIVAVDKLVRSELLGCAGTLDIEGAEEILDVKCSGRISWKYWIQVAMYNFMLPSPKPYLSILRFHKSLGIYEYKKIPYHTNLVKIFIGLLRAYRFAQAGGYDDLNATDQKIGEESELDCPKISDDRAGRNW